MPLTAPPTPWNRAIGPQRRMSFARVSLADVKRIKDARRLHRQRRRAGPHGRHAAPLPRRPQRRPPGRAADRRVPRVGADATTRPGRRTTRSRPCSRAWPPTSTTRSSASASSTRCTKGAKEDHDLLGASLLQDWAEYAAPTTFALAARLYSGMHLGDRHRPIHNVVISNVPGPAVPALLRRGRARVARYPMGPVMEGAGLNITVLSYLDHVDIGFVAVPRPRARHLGAGPPTPRLRWPSCSARRTRDVGSRAATRLPAACEPEAVSDEPDRRRASDRPGARRDRAAVSRALGVNIAREGVGDTRGPG